MIAVQVAERARPAVPRHEECKRRIATQFLPLRPGAFESARPSTSEYWHHRNSHAPSGIQC
eukprot:2817337-Pleurochrysis_carterae.AAC.1